MDQLYKLMSDTPNHNSHLQTVRAQILLVLINAGKPKTRIKISLYDGIGTLKCGKGNQQFSAFSVKVFLRAPPQLATLPLWLLSPYLLGKPCNLRYFISRW